LKTLAIGLSGGLLAAMVLVSRSAAADVDALARQTLAEHAATDSAAGNRGGSSLLGRQLHRLTGRLSLEE
jgi:hypothetical protein